MLFGCSLTWWRLGVPLAQCSRIVPGGPEARVGCAAGDQTRAGHVHHHALRCTIAPPHTGFYITLFSPFLNGITRNHKVTRLFTVEFPGSSVTPAPPRALVTLHSRSPQSVSVPTALPPALGVVTSPPMLCRVFRAAMLEQLKLGRTETVLGRSSSSNVIGPFFSF